LVQSWTGFFVRKSLLVSPSFGAVWWGNSEGEAISPSFEAITFWISDLTRTVDSSLAILHSKCGFAFIFAQLIANQFLQRTQLVTGLFVLVFEVLKSFDFVSRVFVRWRFSLWWGFDLRRSLLRRSGTQHWLLRR
jgi:hypothetical protein